MDTKRPQIKRWRYQCKVPVHPGHEVCKMRAERPESHSLWLDSHRKMLSPCEKLFEHLKNFLLFAYHLTRVCCPEILQGSYGNHDIMPYKSISTARVQTTLFINLAARKRKSCCAPVLMSTLQRSFQPLQNLFSSMDLDIDYYSTRRKDINGLWVFKSTFMTFVGGDTDH
jgi:hypothetical protein